MNIDLYKNVSWLIKFIPSFFAFRVMVHHVTGIYWILVQIVRNSLKMQWSEIIFEENPIPNKKRYLTLKCGFCKKLHLYECNSDQLPTFFSFCHHFWVGATANQQQTHPKVMTEWKKSRQLVRVAFVKK